MRGGGSLCRWWQWSAPARQLTRLSAEELGARDGETARLRESVDKETDRVFRAFCKAIGVKTIREYEETTHGVHRQRQQELAQLTEHLAKLTASLEFERNKAAKAAEDVAEQAAIVAECDAKVPRLPADLLACLYLARLTPPPP